MLTALDVTSPVDVLGDNLMSETLYELLEVSCNTQSAAGVPVETLIRTHFGLNPVYTNGPSAEPLPGYEPKAEKPGTDLQQ